MGEARRRTRLSVPETEAHRRVASRIDAKIKQLEARGLVEVEILPAMAEDMNALTADDFRARARASDLSCADPLAEERMRGEEASRVLRQQLGFDPPIAELRHWLLADAGPADAAAQVQAGANGRPATLVPLARASTPSKQSRIERTSYMAPASTRRPGRPVLMSAPALIPSRVCPMVTWLGVRGVRSAARTTACPMG